MGLLNVVTWGGDVVALVTALAMIKDTILDRAAARRLLSTLKHAAIEISTTGQHINLAELRPALRFGIRMTLLVMVAASAGVCVVFPASGEWQGMVLRTALALHMATQVPCPWFRWITVGDVRAKLNDPPGVERRVH